MAEELRIKRKVGKGKRIIFFIGAAVILLLVAGVWLAVSGGVTAKKVERQLLLGEKYLTKLKYEQAVAAYEKAIEIDPKNVEAYLGLAEVYEEWGEYELAEDILDEAKERIRKEEEIEQLEQKEKKIKRKKKAQKEKEPGSAGAETKKEAASAQEYGALEKIIMSYEGGHVTFGSYEQDNNLENGPEPISWTVLELDEEGALLFSDYGLDAKPYNEIQTAVTWETCTLRKWLNTDFFNAAFNEEEKRAIKDTELVNHDNETYGVSGGNDTVDKVFLLSVNELSKFYPYANELQHSERFLKATEYAKAQGVLTYEEFEAVFWQNSWWWLRTPGIQQEYASRVLCSGMVVDSGDGVAAVYQAVRPAIRVIFASQDQ